MKLLQKLLKKIPVLGPVYGITVSSDDIYSPVTELICKIYGSLSPKCRYDSLGMLHLDDIHHILCGKRFEVELIRACIIR